MKYGRLAALFIIALLLSPTLATHVLAQETYTEYENLNIYPEDKSQYTQLINIAESNETAMDSWYYLPPGRFIGSSIPESEYQFDEITENGDILTVAQEVTFSQDEILTGISEFYVRSPVKHSSDWDDGNLYIFAVENDCEYHINSNGQLCFSRTASGGTMAVQKYHTVFSSSDTTINDDNDHYSKDERTYFRISAPIRPNVRYLFVWMYEYNADGRISVFISFSDISGRNSSVNIINLNGGTPKSNKFSQAFNIDFGISFVMVSGMSNGVSSMRVYMESGDYLGWNWKIQDADNGTERIDYYTMMLPFISGGYVNYSLRIESEKAPLDSYVYTGNGYNQTDYIIHSTDDYDNREGYSSTNSGRITFTNDVGWMTFFVYEGANTIEYNSSGTSPLIIQNYSYPVDTFSIYTSGKYYHSGFSLYISQQMTANAFSGPPDYFGFVYPELTDLTHAFTKTEVYRSLEGLLKFWGKGITVTSTALAFMFPAATPAIAPVAAVGATMWLAGTIMHKYRTDPDFREATDRRFINPIANAINWGWDKTQQLWEWWNNTSIKNVLDTLGTWVKKVFIFLETVIEFVKDFMENLILLDLQILTYLVLYYFGGTFVQFYALVMALGFYTNHLVIAPKQTIQETFNFVIKAWSYASDAYLKVRQWVE